MTRRRPARNAPGTGAERPAPAPPDPVPAERAHDEAGTEPAPAGPFGAWLDQTLASLSGTTDAEVPCGSCTACCAASQFVHIAPDEAETLAHVPGALLFPAPGRPRGHVLMGYDEHGRCPMLIGGACSIYEHRPRTCRTYDCRVLAAAEVDVALDDPTKRQVAERVRRWAFTFEDDPSLVRRRAVAAAAAYLRAHAAQVRPGLVPDRPTQLAVAAVAVHHLFVPPPLRTADRAHRDHLPSEASPTLAEVVDALERRGRRG